MPSSLRLVLAVVTFYSLAVSAAPAQWISKWGHPVITLGGTPYDTSSSGHGNYPGSPGFIPGYGYYPGPGPGTYPWIDGPGVPFDRRKIAVSEPVVPDGPPPGVAWVEVKIPAEAELFLNDVPTQAEGSYRVFVTPQLTPNGPSHYELRARWLIQGHELTRTESIDVRQGSTTTVNFLTIDGWTGTKLTSSK